VGKFSKIKKYSKPSLDINEKIGNLNKELEKVGMLSEKMTTLGGLAFRGGWLGWNYLAYPSGSGIRGVGTTRFPGEGVGQAIYSAYSNWPYEGKVVKTVYQWQQLDCLFGSCQGASQYYPSDRSATSTPKADRALYAWTIWLPADADGNLLKNRIMTDPGSPAVPGVPAVPPKPVVLDRFGLGDPDYFIGFIQNALMAALDIGRRGLEYLMGKLNPFSQPGIEFVTKVAGELLNTIKDVSTKIFNGVTDGLLILSDVNSAIETAEKYGGLIPPKPGEDRPTIMPGAPGSRENPVQRTLSPSTNKTIISGINRNMKGSVLRTIIQNNINTDFNFGAKGTLNNLTSDPYFNDDGDLVIDDTYAFDPGGDVGEKPFLFGGTTGDVAKTLSGALVGGGGKNEANRVELEKDILTKFDQSIGAILPITPGRKDPIVHIRIVIPASSVPASSTSNQSSNLKEGWESPKHTYIEPNERKRWFNPNDIAPEYPTKEPNTGIYTPSGEPVDSKEKREPYIKLTQKDLLRNHRLKDSEVKEMMDTINALNAFLDAHPEELIHAQKRYPKNDVRLAELNWKMDQMLFASEEYMDTHFPENTRLFNKLQKSIKRNIELTDPKTFKNVKSPVTVNQLFTVDYISKEGIPILKKKSKSKNKKSPARFLKKPRLKTKSEMVQEKLSKFQDDLKKFGIDA
jgi:hypothetical protein